MAIPAGATLNYQERDNEIVDYQFYELSQAPGVQFRGPAIELADNSKYFTCIGAAQTLGIYIEKPFPNLLAEHLGVPALNLAVGASWPGFYSNRHPELLDIVNRGEFLILQVMSARGESTSRFEATDVVEMMRERKTGDTITSVHAWAKILAEEPDFASQYVEELRAGWVKSNLELIAKVKVPIILFWYSRRQQDEPTNFSLEGDVFQNMGEFPQFVDSKSVNAVAAKCSGFVECRSSRNTGHPLISRFTGEPAQVNHSSMSKNPSIKGDQSNFLEASTNHYYPSPEMHQDAAHTLVDEIKKLQLV
jgi:hypothetical protein